MSFQSSVPLMPNVLKVFLENGQTRSFRYTNDTLVEVGICSLIQHYISKVKGDQMWWIFVTGNNFCRRSWRPLQKNLPSKLPKTSDLFLVDLVEDRYLTSTGRRKFVRYDVMVIGLSVSHIGDVVCLIN
mgnify:CR=1 FL=1